MPSVVHVVTTPNFAGTERYVCDVSVETARRGWETTIVGGDPAHMAGLVTNDVRWLPGSTPLAAIRSLARLGRQDVVHAHMTLAEAVSVIGRRGHRAPIISTRHFAQPRGSTPFGRLLAPWIAARLDTEIAISDFVRERLERPPHAVIRNGVPPSPCLWRAANHVVLVLQRLEEEKDTRTALRAWQLSGLERDGWSLRVVGDGSQRGELEAWVAAEAISGVTFVGKVANVNDEFEQAGLLLAPAPAEPFGLAVVEALAAGIPVVASAAGGHLETVGLIDEAPLFPPGDAEAASAALRLLSHEAERSALSRAGRNLVDERFKIADHVDLLLGEYQATRLRTAAVAP